MRFAGKTKLIELQRKPSNIRNICILAHVDHGKTTLADSFISSNGIISSRLAGQLRYLDSREDEQLRGITMKSSAIALGFNKENEEYLINLIDTPGHVDFSSEVSTAVRLCDGALVVVDVVEGVSPQTHVVLHQAWLEDIKPCLVLNKIDRLITELKYTPLEAYVHLQQVLEQVNAVMGNLFASDILEQASSRTTTKEDEMMKPSQLENQTFDWSSGLEDIDDSSIYFSPEEGNVVFASAFDGWGFGIEQFADQYAKKLGVSKAALSKTLWGDFYLNSKSMRVMKGAQAKGKKPLFVQFVLENIWAVYDAVILSRDEVKMEKIIKSLNLQLGPRDMKQKETRLQLKAILNKWLPVTTCTLSMVCSQLPSPTEMSEKRIEKLFCSSGRRFDSLPEGSQKLKAGFQNIEESISSPVVVFISKMFAVDRKFLPQNKQRPLTAEEIAKRRQEVRRLHLQRQNLATSQTAGEIAGENTKTCSTINVEATGNDKTEESSSSTEIEENDGQAFIAFARIFSGVIKKGQKVYVMGPQYDPRQCLGQEDEEEWRKHVHEVIVSDLYLLMGRDLEDVDEVPAGNVFGMGGLEDIIYKSGTVSSTLACPAFTDMNFAAKPIVRVAIEPKHLSDMPILINGMRLLNQADSSVEVFIQETGEHVLVAAGEVHLGKCLKDLRERFAQIELDVSVPIVPFRETVIPQPKVDMVNEVIGDVNTIQVPKQFVEELQTEGVDIMKDGAIEIATPNKLHKFRLRAVPLPPCLVSLLEDHTELLQILDTRSTAVITGKTEEGKSQALNEKTISQLNKLRKVLTSAFDEAGRKWKGTCDKIWSFGPKRCGPNILVNRIVGYDRPSIWNCMNDTKLMDLSTVRNFDSCVVGGFQLVTLSGPMCDEPMMGVCFIVENWEVEEAEGKKKPKNFKARKRNYLPADTENSGKTALKNLESKSSGADKSEIRGGEHTSEDPQNDEIISSETEQNVTHSSEISAEIPFSQQNCVNGIPLTHKCLEFDTTSDEKAEQVGECTTLDFKNDEVTPSEKEKSPSEDESGVTTSHEDKIAMTVVIENSEKLLTERHSHDMIDKPEKNLTTPDARDENVAIGDLPRSKTEDIAERDHEVASQTSLGQTNSAAVFDSGKSKYSRIQQHVYGPVSGQIISTIKEGCKAAFQTQPQRLMAAMYKCNIQATADVLGPLYSVVSKRFGRVLQEEMREGSTTFDILTTLPVAESFGFPEEIRKKTSGLASPQLFFSHWEVVPGDPYWVPSTEEELLHFGEKADSGSQARKYLDGVRRRKGLHVKEHIVEHAEKQRTLSKNK